MYILTLIVLSEHLPVIRALLKKVLLIFLVEWKLKPRFGKMQNKLCYYACTYVL